MKDGGELPCSVPDTLQLCRCICFRCDTHLRFAKKKNRKSYVAHNKQAVIYISVFSIPCKAYHVLMSRGYHLAVNLFLLYSLPNHHIK